MPAAKLSISPLTPLLMLPSGDTWTVQDSLEGTQIFGASGSGKTSGSGSALAYQMLKAGYGGLILTVKNDDHELWSEPTTGLCARTGRSNDLIVVSKDGEHQFDFLEYELHRSGPGAGDTSELARLFSTVLDAAGSGTNSSSDQYWPNAENQLVKNSIDLARFATGRVSLQVLSTIIHEAPLTLEETKGEDWRAMVRLAEAKAKTEREKRDLAITLDYFNREFPRLAPNTRSCIVSMFTSMADTLLRGSIGSLFSSGKYTLTPELSHEGKLILINLPVKEFGDVGRFSQMLFKYIWQKAAERRDKSKPMRPIFLWADESQEFVTGYDAAFQATARSSAVATVYLTQNLRNYHARMGGTPKAEAETESLLGNLNTKIFHANGDTATNQWAEKMFGNDTKRRAGASVTGASTTVNWNQATEPTIPSKKFTMLRKGSMSNDGMIDAIIYQTGRKWAATDDNYIEIPFEQPQIGG